MKIRVAAVVGLTLVGMLSSGASAKTCNLMQDDKGDAFLIGAPGESSDPNLDIISGDVASNAKDITGVIRLSSVTDLNPRSPGGQFFALLWTVKGNTNPIGVWASILPKQAPVFTYGELVASATSNTYTKIGDATGVVDTATGEVRITAPVAGFAGKGDVKPGSTMKDLLAEARARGGVLVFDVDSAAGKRAYTAGEASCVAVGK